MEYRKLGKWGIKVSTIGLGSWLTTGTTINQADNDKLINHAYNLGINFFDTANVYALGQAEVVMGKSLKSIKRDNIVLATKVFFPMGDGPNDKGLSRKHVFEQCNQSLKRLNVDYIDLYQCHRYDPAVPMYELVQTMHDLTVAGKILYWGVSEWPASQIQAACDMAYELKVMPPISNQPCYNLLHRTIESDVIPVCESMGLGQLVFSPLAQGVLTGKYKPHKPLPPDSRAGNENINMFLKGRNYLETEVLEAVEKFATLAVIHKTTAASLALAWCLRNQNVTSAIIGATKEQQLDENVKAINLKLVDDLFVEAEKILKPYADL